MHHKALPICFLGLALCACQTSDQRTIGAPPPAGLTPDAGGSAGPDAAASLDKSDRLAQQQTTQNALETSPSFRTSEWMNPETGHSGTVTPQPAFVNPQGRYCREYQQIVTIGGKSVEAYGTACRQPDGSWKIVQ